MKLKKSNNLEVLLYNILVVILPITALERQFQFDNIDRGERTKKGKVKYRKWRFDFAYPAIKTAFEVEGGIWIGGKHVNPSGFIKDCEKYNAAVKQGWKVYRLTSSMLTKEYIEELLF